MEVEDPTAPSRHHLAVILGRCDDLPMSLLGDLPGLEHGHRCRAGEPDDGWPEIGGLPAARIDDDQLAADVEDLLEEGLDV